MRGKTHDMILNSFAENACEEDGAKQGTGLIIRARLPTTSGQAVVH